MRIIGESIESASLGPPVPKPAAARDERAAERSQAPGLRRRRLPAQSRRCLRSPLRSTDQSFAHTVNTPAEPVRAPVKGFCVLCPVQISNCWAFFEAANSRVLIISAVGSGTQAQSAFEPLAPVKNSPTAPVFVGSNSLQLLRTATQRCPAHYTVEAEAARGGTALGVPR